MFEWDGVERKRPPVEAHLGQTPLPLVEVAQVPQAEIIGQIDNIFKKKSIIMLSNYSQGLSIPDAGDAVIMVKDVQDVFHGGQLRAPGEAVC